jgi:NADPH:quinone reductase-like Zn-dependent oxidoreductase
MATANSICRAFRSNRIKALVRASDEANGVLAHQIQQNAPVLSGDLAGSVEAVPAVVRGSKITSAVAVTSDHALAVEYGTEDMAPEPYFRPAVDSERSKMIRIVERTS